MSWLYLLECDENYKKYIGGLPGNKPDERGYKQGWRDAMMFLGGQAPSPEVEFREIGILNRPRSGDVHFIQSAEVIPLGLHETLTVYMKTEPQSESKS